ncbi:MAG: hypothetical protein IKP88_00120 [Lachnospiraceae bacterium]|nr:hypothetical protein [Lachnospiraceae bacterium]
MEENILLLQLKTIDYPKTAKRIRELIRNSKDGYSGQFGMTGFDQFLSEKYELEWAVQIIQKIAKGVLSIRFLHAVLNYTHAKANEIIVLKEI